MNAKQFHRRDMVKALALGTAQLAPLLPSQVASAAPEKVAGWRPKFFSEPDAGFVAVIAELIIPRTDTPSAKDAKVHEHIDRVLNDESDEVQKSFLEGLRWMNRRSLELYHKEFSALETKDQVALLSRISNSNTLQPVDRLGHEFFLEIRQRLVFAYYTSKIGLEQELTYKGGQVLDHWEGCPHPDHHGDAV
jgi:hypothetical protein